VNINMSALSYYTAKNRASSRLDTKKNEISRSSAYMIDTGGSYNKTSSYTPSSSTLKRESSFTGDSGRAGRTRYRDHSVDYLSRPSRRSSSLEISAPIKPRTRDISTDLTSSRRDYTNGISSTSSYVPSSRASRPKTTNFEDEHSEEYKRIMANTDKYLTMSKYTKTDKETEDVNGMVEEERRSKAYSKIINQQSVASLETDCARETLNNIFMNTSGFSAKSVQAITKEMLYKEERPKNYSWRKDMENYEENLEKTAQHKKNVREATKATRDVGFKDTNSKIRDYDRECRRNVDYDEPKTNGIVINTKPITQTPSYSTTVERKNNENNSYRSSQTISSIADSTVDNTSEVKRGSWRKDMEKYEEQISKKKQQSEPKIDLTQKITSSAVNSEPKTYSWQKSKDSSTDKKTSETLKDATSSWKKPDTIKPVEVKAPEPSWRKTETVKVDEPKKTEPVWKKPDTVNKVECKESEPIKSKEPEKSVPTWKKQVEEVKPVSEPKTLIPEKSKTVEEKVVEPEKTAPKWKKPESAKTETVTSLETKAVETEKTVPKWKKQTEIKTEEPAPAPAPVEPEKKTPKWKKPEPAPKEEAKPAETPKPTPKWKKPEAAKKEEPKPAETKPADTEKPVPKWKKQTTVKKEEPKPAEPEKPVPKWKKPAAPKKEEQKPSEPEKPVPKWKKPEAAKVEEKKEEQPEKPVPKWKKPAASKKEEPKEEPEPTPTVSVPEPVKEPEPEPESQTKTDSETQETGVAPVTNSEEPVKTEEEKTEEEKEEEDVTGMRAMRKEQASKFSDMDAEFAAGASKLSALRAKMKALRMKHKAAAEADAAA